MKQAHAAVQDIIRGKHWNGKFYGYAKNIIYIDKHKYFATEDQLNEAMYKILIRLYHNDDIPYTYPYLKRFTKAPKYARKEIMQVFKKARYKRNLRYIYYSQKDYLKASKEEKYDHLGKLIPKALRQRKFKGD